MEDSTTGAADGILKSRKDDFSFCERWQNPFGRGPGRVPPHPQNLAKEDGQADRHDKLGNSLRITIGQHVGGGYD